MSGVGGIKSYSGAMGALNAIVGSGDMTMQDLADAMGTGVMAVAKSYGQTINQVGAALAVFGDNNIRGAKAGTDLRMTWQAIQAPIKAGIPLLNQLGLSASQLGKTMEHHGLSDAIGQFIAHLKASKVPVADWGSYITQIFGKKAGVGIGILVDQLSRLKSKFPDLEKGASGFGNAWKQQQKTVGQQFNDLEAGLEALAIKMGEKLLPAALAVVRGITRFVNALEQGKAPALAIAGVIGWVLARVALDKLAGGQGRRRDSRRCGRAARRARSSWRPARRRCSPPSSRWPGRPPPAIQGLIGKLSALTGAQEAQTAATQEGAVAQDEMDAAWTPTRSAHRDRPGGAGRRHLRGRKALEGFQAVGPRRVPRRRGRRQGRLELDQGPLADAARDPRRPDRDSGDRSRTTGRRSPRTPRSSGTTSPGSLTSSPTASRTSRRRSGTG